jgi:hypothetical protein
MARAIIDPDEHTRTHVASPRLFLEHEATKKRIPIHDGFTIGRKGAHQDYPDDNVMSRRHCRFDVLPDGSVMCTDLNSTNRAHINGRKMEAGLPVQVLSGDRLEIGSQFFIAHEPAKTKAKFDRVAMGGDRRKVITRALIGVGLVGVVATVLVVGIPVLKLMLSKAQTRAIPGVAAMLNEACFEKKEKDACSVALSATVSLKPEMREQVVSKLPLGRQALTRQVIRKAEVAMRTAQTDR